MGVDDSPFQTGLNGAVSIQSCHWSTPSVDGGLSNRIEKSSKNITNDLAIGLRVSLETAEKIKTALSKLEKEGGENDELDFKKLNLKILSHDR